LSCRTSTYKVQSIKRRMGTRITTSYEATLGRSNRT